MVRWLAADRRSGQDTSCPCRRPAPASGCRRAENWGPARPFLPASGRAHEAKCRPTALFREAGRLLKDAKTRRDRFDPPLLIAADKGGVAAGHIDPGLRSRRARAHARRRRALRDRAVVFGYLNRFEHGYDFGALFFEPRRQQQRSAELIGWF